MEVKLHHLRPAPGAHKRSKRVGRGHGSGKGKTSGRGTKGTGARNTIHPWFEGGQMPLQRRLPKLGGFSNPNRVEYASVNVERLAGFPAQSTVDPETLRSKGLVRKGKGPVKILGRGDVTVALTVKAHAVSESARRKIEAAGGRVELL
ncbi:MAG: 50S ribosomal protein L15 [Actinomycetota bacterium]|nr:50S ribosomal protein L15 [Actinomycetota bacterium]